MEFYILINDIKHGPFSVEQLSSKNITPNTLVWSAGFAGWIPAGQVEQLVELLASLPPEPPKPPTKPLMPKTWLVESIVVTSLCCLPFGVMGIVYATKVEASYNAGNYATALSYSALAKKWTMIGGITTLVFALLYILIVTFYVASTKSILI